MTDGIFLIQPDDALVAMRSQPYASEDLLQRLLAAYPDLMAGDQFGHPEPRRWVLVAREQGVPDAERAANRWALDHLFLDQDAVPTLVEVKRATDTRLRREVVAQMLDYAANAVTYWPLAELRTAFARRCSEAGTAPEDALAELLGEEGADPDEFWRRVEANLRSGRIRLVFVADAIPDELRRIVEFLNEQMRPATVLALEVKQYVGQNLRTLVPRVIGQTAKAQLAKAVSGPRERLSEEQWFARLGARCGPEVERQARALVAWFRAQADAVAPTRAQDSLYVLVRDGAGRARYAFFVQSRGQVALGLRWLKRAPAFRSEPARRALIERLRAIPGVQLATENPDGFPAVALEALIDPSALAAFQAVALEVINRLRGV